MISKILFVIGVSVSIISCSTARKQMMQGKLNPKIDWQAHRGGRGLMPENTIPAMQIAIDHNVTTLELDLQITKDKRVVVSHDPSLNYQITTTPEGKYLSKKEGQNMLLYNMTYDSVKMFDVGMKPYTSFPRQQKIKVSIPLLSDLIDSCEVYASSKGKTILYNLEIKSNSAGDNAKHPAPAEFIELVLAVVKNKNVLSRISIQSFDVRPLQYLNKNYPTIRTSFLVEKNVGDLDGQLSLLGFIPKVYSPYYLFVTKQLVEACHKRNIKIVPWTVNKAAEIDKLLSDGVDGIISDYPDLFDGR